MNMCSNQSMLAIAAVVYIAMNATEKTPVRARLITARLNTANARAVEPALQALVRARILISARGASGGYRLRKPATDITIGQIVTITSLLNISPEIEADSLEYDAAVAAILHGRKAFSAAIDVFTVADLMRVVKDESKRKTRKAA